MLLRTIHALTCEVNRVNAMLAVYHSSIHQAMQPMTLLQGDKALDWSGFLQANLNLLKSEFPGDLKDVETKEATRLSKQLTNGCLLKATTRHPPSERIYRGISQVCGLQDILDNLYQTRVVKVPLSSASGNWRARTNASVRSLITRLHGGGDLVTQKRMFSLISKLMILVGECGPIHLGPGRPHLVAAAGLRLMSLGFLPPPSYGLLQNCVQLLDFPSYLVDEMIADRFRALNAHPLARDRASGNMKIYYIPGVVFGNVDDMARLDDESKDEGVVNMDAYFSLIKGDTFYAEAERSPSLERLVGMHRPKSDAHFSILHATKKSGTGGIGIHFFEPYSDEKIQPDERALADFTKVAKSIFKLKDDTPVRFKFAKLCVPQSKDEYWSCGILSTKVATELLSRTPEEYAPMRGQPVDEKLMNEIKEFLISKCTALWRFPEGIQRSGLFAICYSVMRVIGLVYSHLCYTTQPYDYVMRAELMLATQGYLASAKVMSFGLSQSNYSAASVPTRHPNADEVTLPRALIAQAIGKSSRKVIDLN